MQKILFSLIAAFVLVGCNQSDDAMKCGAYEVQIEQHENSITATLNGDSVELMQSVAASGVRYVGILNDTEVMLWNKGSDWTLFLNDEEPAPCKN
ncbi:MliC family protein [Lachnospiraceae bacterium OttesenSCG-928-E19]|nr:MliC family protein [Lachnospiraceae bacterium OttesenSCG-928-E19]